MIKKRLPDWLSSYVKFTTENSESPTSYHTWAGIAAIACALQRRVYMRWGHSEIFPNQYIILVGPSGKARKGEPVMIARDLVKRLSIPMIGEDNSAESIIRDMRNAVTTFKNKTTGDITFQCAVCNFSEELSVFTGYQNVKLLAYLTNWYDSRSDWSRSTKHQGDDNLMGVCFNLLASTAPDWLTHILPQEAIGGGFTSRVIFVVEDKKGKVITNPNLIPVDKRLEADLLHDLEIMLTLSGEVTFDKQALNKYERWYASEEKKIENNSHDLLSPLLSGYLSRRPTHVKKIAMAISASRGGLPYLTEEDFVRALHLMEMIEVKMPTVYRGIGSSRYHHETELVIEFISKKGTATKAEVLSGLYRQVDDFSLEAAIKTLCGMKVIKATRRPGTEDMVYEYLDRGKEFLQ